MNKYLIKLADHLDEKGLHKEADYVDWIMKNAFFGLGKPKSPDQQFIEKVKAYNSKYIFENVNEVIEVDGIKAAIGVAKGKMMQAVRDASMINAYKKLDFNTRPAGSQTPVFHKFDLEDGVKAVYMLVTVPKQ